MWGGRGEWVQPAVVGHVVWALVAWLPGLVDMRQFSVALRTFFLAWLAAGTFVSSTEAFFQGGQRGGFRENWILEFLARDNIRAELKISDRQRTDLEELSKTFEEQRQALRQGFRGMTRPEEFQARMEEVRKKGEELGKQAEEKVKGILDAQQFTRYRQVFLQSLGGQALAREEIITELKFTDDQKQRLQQVQEEFRGKLQQLGFFGNPEERQKLLDERDAALKGVLTASQQTVWEAKLGPRFDAEAAPGSPTTAGGGPGAPVAGSGDSGNAQAPRRTDRKQVVESAPTGPIVADFSGKPTGPTGGEMSTDSSAGEGGRPEMNPDGVEVRFNFRFAPWENVLKLFAETAGLSLDMNEVPSGTFNYFDSKTYTVREALDVLNGYLLRKGFTLVYRDRFLVVWNLDEPPPPNLIPQVTLEDLGDRGKNE